MFLHWTTLLPMSFYVNFNFNEFTFDEFNFKKFAVDNFTFDKFSFDEFDGPTSPTLHHNRQPQQLPPHPFVREIL